uniref:Mitogen-activated protein kinase n=1 Tax=Dermatophagoides pteronyssinus TaxID=6956 RepID=A0A6P6YBY4_DERPT|nr:mitogen-activated protein kinase 4b-like [Dermatophagoides pteronyssinus]
MAYFDKNTTVLVSRYRLNGVLGVGSYGKVWSAYDQLTNKVVAIKKIARLFNDLTDCKRVLREICLLNLLKSHNNIVKLYDMFIDETQTLDNFDTIFLVLEISDSDLRKILKQNIYLTELHVVNLVYNLLCGLHFLHLSGVYHRDLKPANCLVNKDCVVKICDFGLSRNRAMKKQLTTHVVTRWYRAPELILLEKDYTDKIDVWSVGCIFSELLQMIQENCLDYRSITTS